MKQVTLKLYKFDELSDDVRNEIAESQSFEVMSFAMDGHYSEYESSLKSFENETGFKAVRWEVGYYLHRFDIEEPEGHVMGTMGYPIYPQDCKGKLLWRWCRDFIDNNRKGKYYGKLVPCEKSVEHPVGLKHIFIHSKATAEPITGGWCPWTGCITDCSLVEPIVDFYLNYHRGKFSESYDLEDLIGDCLEKFFNDWENEYNAYGNNENGCVEEFISANSDGDLYLADGRKYDGPDIDELEEFAA